MALPRVGKVGIVACGGGYKVAFTIGVCKCLSFLGINVSLVSTVSGSALTLASWIADGFKAEELEKENAKIDTLGDNFIFNKNYIRLAGQYYKNRNSLFEDAGLLALINGRKDLGLKGIDIKSLLTSPTELRITVRNETEEERQEYISSFDPQFRNNHQKLKLYLQATASPIGFLPPVKIDECFYSDGMYPDLECAVGAGCDTIFVIYNDLPPTTHLENLSWVRRMPHNLSTIHNDMMEKELEKIIKQHSDFIVIERDTKTPWIKRCYKHFSAIATSAKRGDDINLVPHRIIVLSPEKIIGTLGTLEFSKGDLITALQHGYECATNAIENL